MQQYSLSDASTALRAYTDQTHKFWGYFQVVTAGVLGFAFARDQTELPILVLTMGYACFSYFNGKLVCESQTAARAVWEAIQAYGVRVRDDIPVEFRGNLCVYMPQTPERVRLTHGAIWLVALVLLAVRYWFVHSGPPMA